MTSQGAKSVSRATGIPTRIFGDAHARIEQAELAGPDVAATEITKGDALELVQGFDLPIDLLVTDPPYAFGGSGGEHALSATVAIVLREAARKMATGSYAVVFAASSWRSTAYMVESLRGVLEPVRIGTWTKPESRTKVATAGWRWASVNAIAFRKGKGREIATTDRLDHICAAPVRNGRRAELPPEVADWAVAPFAIPSGVFLDPFAGSGALPFAAERAGMSAYGFERDPASHLQQGSLSKSQGEQCPHHQAAWTSA